MTRKIYLKTITNFYILYRPSAVFNRRSALVRPKAALCSATVLRPFAIGQSRPPDGGHPHSQICEWVQMQSVVDQRCFCTRLYTARISECETTTLVLRRQCRPQWRPRIRREDNQWISMKQSSMRIINGFIVEEREDHRTISERAPSQINFTSFIPPARGAREQLEGWRYHFHRL